MLAVAKAAIPFRGVTPQVLYRVRLMCLIVVCLALPGCQSIIRDNSDLSFIDGKFTFKTIYGPEYPEKSPRAEENRLRWITERLIGYPCGGGYEITERRIIPGTTPMDKLMNAGLIFYAGTCKS